MMMICNCLAGGCAVGQEKKKAEKGMLPAI